MLNWLKRQFSKVYYQYGLVDHMPNIDFGPWVSRVGINPPGGFVGTAIASTSTVAPITPIVHVTGTGSIGTITLPWTGFIGRLTLIADGAWTMTTTGNIATVFTAVSGQALELVYDGSAWYPLISD